MKLFTDKITILDGGMGTVLQQRGLPAGGVPERLNLTDPALIQSIHLEYLQAGSEIITANTFGANALHFDKDELESIIAAALQNAKAAVEESGKAAKVALDIGPTGKLLKPYGDLDFEAAVEIFAQTVRLGVKHGADLILIETMNDSYETKAALLAAKENSVLPVIVSNAYGADGKLMTGATPAAMIALLEGMGADAIGVNCSLGPVQLRGVVEEYLQCSSLPVLLMPNAGLPREVDGNTVFDVSPAEFAAEIKAQVCKGVLLVGGCCGTTPAHIKAVANAVKTVAPQRIEEKERIVVSSYTHAVEFGKEPRLIGERINPTGKKRLKAALIAEDMDYILSQGLEQAEKGAHLLDVNVGLPDVDEVALLPRVTEELQTVCDLPLQLDSADPAALEAALRRYNGKAMINSVSGKAESMAAVFPLAQKYGGLVVALTLDESGIPTTAVGRIAIAKRILAEAEKYGLGKKDLIFDPLAMTVSADPTAATVTLTTLRRIKEELGCAVSLGVSNVSFGLPRRELVTASFFTAALERGLDAAIMNPLSVEMQQAYYTHRLLHGLDENCADYVAFAATLTDAVPTVTPVASPAKPVTHDTPLKEAVFKGLGKRAAALTAEQLTHSTPLEIINEEIIPALDRVGAGFAAGTLFLPALLMSAEAASAAFEVIRAAAPEQKSSKYPIVLATVKGDIHDIGKNIVKLLLQNYGYDVCDLGRDVPPEAVLAAVKETGAPLVALSALMTTTVPAMEETVRLVKAECPACRVMVGGAVMTEEYATRIGADFYGSDALAAVRIAEGLR